MAKKRIDEEPMLEESTDEILLEETTSEETLLEESGESEVLLEESSEEVLLEESADSETLLEDISENVVLLEEDSIGSALLEENSEILQKKATVYTGEETNSQEKDLQQTFTEIHERWDDKLPKEFIDKVLINASPFCSIEGVENKIFRSWDNWLYPDNAYILDIRVIGEFRRQKIAKLREERAKKEESKEAKDRWKSILNDLHDIDNAIRDGETYDDFAIAFKHNVSLSQEFEEFLQYKYKENIKVNEYVEHIITASLKNQNLSAIKESVTILDEVSDDMLQVLKQSQKRKVQQDFTEIYERWDGKLPKEFIDKVLIYLSPLCSIEDIENRIFRSWDSWLNSDDDDLKHKSGFEHIIRDKLINFVRQILEDQLTPKEIIRLSDKIYTDSQLPLISHFNVKTKKYRKQQANAAINSEKTDAKTKREVEVSEARRAKATPKRKQIAEEDAIEEIEGKRRKWGCISIIAIIFIYSILPSSIKSCQEEDESKDYVEKLADVTYDNDEDGIQLSSLETIKELEKKYDAVMKYRHYFKIEKNEKFGIADLKGNIKIEPKYDAIYLSEESKTIEIQINNKCGLLSSKNFTIIVEPVYDHIGLFNEETRLFEVCKNNKYGLFNPSSKKEVAPCIYDYISFEYTHYLVRKDRKLGFLNLDGSYRGPLK